MLKPLCPVTPSKPPLVGNGSFAESLREGERKPGVKGCFVAPPCSTIGKSQHMAYNRLSCVVAQLLITDAVAEVT